MTQVQWVKYFYEMSRFAAGLSDDKFPELEGLMNVSEKFLKKHMEKE